MEKSHLFPVSLGFESFFLFIRCNKNVQLYHTARNPPLEYPYTAYRVFVYRIYFFAYLRSLYVLYVLIVGECLFVSSKGPTHYYFCTRKVFCDHAILLPYVLCICTHWKEKKCPKLAISPRPLVLNSHAKLPLYYYIHTTTFFVWFFSNLVFPSGLDLVFQGF